MHGGHRTIGIKDLCASTATYARTKFFNNSIDEQPELQFENIPFRLFVKFKKFAALRTILKS